MSTEYSDYGDFFQTGFGRIPFDFQRRLAEQDLPSLINAPTGAGKTAAILGAWLWRRMKKPSSVGRRLIYCLPMRTLVEQTYSVAECALKNLNLQDRVKLHKLLGGDVSLDWDMYPERECILIGTRDMLLSRALNRGYAMSRFRWPVHFGLLNNDCLWVFDEIQLMGDGLATTSQLAAFRDRFKNFGDSHSIWMSATLDKDWLRSIDFAPQVDSLKSLVLSPADRVSEILAKRLNATKHLTKANTSCRLPAGVARFVREKHQAGTQTLIVVNTVNRAREVYDELNKVYGKVPGIGKSKSAAAEQVPTANLQVELIHSRFRPNERKRWAALFDEKIEPSGPGRIIVATQVIEAGVDISSRLLITDIAPFPSLVQRFGRCNRTGDDGEAEIYWVDRPLTEKTAKLAEEEQIKDEDLDKIAAPYESSELNIAQEKLEQLQSASPSILEKVDYKAPYIPAHVLRRRDLVDLFDTTSDLSGFDLDVSRFVRGGDERDVSVAWRKIGDKKPDKLEPRLTRDELCPAPLYGTEGIKEFIKNKTAWTWDALEGEWRKVNADELRAGLTLLFDNEVGGYDDKRGWDAKSKQTVDLVKPETDEPNNAQDDDPQSWKHYIQALAAHSLEARQAAERILSGLGDLYLAEWHNDLLYATQHHDWGKAHPIFQETLHAGLDEAFIQNVLAKSTSHAHHKRPRFRHELASALGLLQSGSVSDLVVYLAACHHGKVRLSIRALPGEKKPEDQSADAKYARGIYDSDELPETDLGDGVIKEKVVLDLEPMLLGRSASGQSSWLGRMLVLRENLGVFRLAYLECLIRAADVQASAFPENTL